MAKILFKKKLRIAYITTELTPLAKAGGLGDVAAALPKALVKEFTVEPRIFMAKYKTIDFEKYPAEQIMKNLQIKMPNEKRWVKISLWKTFLPNTKIPVYLIDFDNFITKEHGIALGDIGKSYKDSPNYLYSFIAKAVLEIIKAMDWHPDVIHYHDGFEAMASKWLKTIYKNKPFYRDIATVSTIHNLASQPIGPIESAKVLGLKRSDFSLLAKLTGQKSINLMAEAIDNADMVNTVSPTYAREIMTKKLGKDLYPVLQKNKKRFTGIINGLDYKDFDPRTNKDVKANYGLSSLNLKKENKLYLQRKFGLKESVDIPLFCVITRLVGQKGLDLIRDVIPEIVAAGGQIIILGSGWKNFEEDFKNAQKKYLHAVAAEMYFDGNLAQTIYAGADIFLMPSGFEPCGLSQIIAMRFGTVPIVRKTGGLADTVKEGYTGFVFKEYDKGKFWEAIKSALNVYANDKKKWRQLQINGMKKDFSWTKSAKKYMWLYRKAIRNHKKSLKLDNKHDN